MYYVKDYQGETIRGGFYEPELQLIKYPDVYLVEKVIKKDKKHKKELVKWIGFSDKHNSWIHESEIIN